MCLFRPVAAGRQSICPDDEYVPLMAIQAVDKERAMDAGPSDEPQLQRGRRLSTTGDRPNKDVAGTC